MIAMPRGALVSDFPYAISVSEAISATKAEVAPPGAAVPFQACGTFQRDFDLIDWSAMGKAEISTNRAIETHEQETWRCREGSQ